MDNDKQQTMAHPPHATLPRGARRSLNRCNLPAVILGGITFQQHPTALYIDGVAELHAPLFTALERIEGGTERARYLMDYMSVHFLLHAPDEAGFVTGQRLDRSRANYQRLLRGWAFNPDGREAAVLKGWVESRFGLTPRFHGAPIRSSNEESYQHYLHHYAEGLYNTNALEAQLDLIYSYCQYELQRSGAASHLTLYRGINRLDEFEQLGGNEYERERTVLLNNLNSFSSSRERAGEFGDQILSARVPREKIAFHAGLLPGVLKGEEEYLVIGGVYEVTIKEW
jgi:NAD+--dinitrogen-reductase ADP-D-ribosyltransferase